MTDKTNAKKGFVIHGVYSQDVLLPWEDREEFKELHDSLVKEFFPIGASEEDCVLTLAILMWQKRRLWRLQTATVSRDPFTQEIVATKAKSWSGVRRNLREKAQAEGSLQKTVEASVARAVTKVTKLGDKLSREATPEEVAVLVPRLNAVVEVATNSLLPLLENVRQLPTAEQFFDRTLSPEAMEKGMQLEAMIDVRITKTMTRLVALKEFKRTPAGSPLTKLAHVPGNRSGPQLDR